MYPWVKITSGGRQNRYQTSVLSEKRTSIIVVHFSATHRRLETSNFATKLNFADLYQTEDLFHI